MTEHEGMTELEKLLEYGKEKRRLAALCLSPDEYEKAIRELAERLEI